MAQLERWLDDLARRWERFVSHDPNVPVPPERERAALERRLRELSRLESLTTGEQFRLDQLLHRFATLTNLWQRQLRDREEARPGATPPRRSLNVAPLAPVEDPDAAYKALYDSFVAAHQVVGANVSVPYDRFRQSLARQRELLESRGDVFEGFDVTVEKAQVKLKARVRRGRNS